MARKETVKATVYTFTAVFEPAVEGGYVVILRPEVLEELAGS